jgi:hypothetical protein
MIYSSILTLESRIRFLKLRILRKLLNLRRIGIHLMLNLRGLSWF